ncbi:MBL fold metallo-hydrolase [Kocuria coralli]|uniref:MBL fold metallo-hydrolase n=1 Tax=Kocuria coralli TaxID=1461025 RepID=A0A5J5L270_9MICC|nr:ComEC/Rec2 family competence protein [Kocuria coralli]KAA9395071.1 MBL fold metallo-hydrolase [Kocuria coralli]
MDWPERQASRKQAARDRELRALRPTWDLRLVPAGITAWAAALLGAGEVMSSPPAPHLVGVLLVSLAAGCVALSRTRARRAIPAVILCSLVASAVLVVGWQDRAATEQSHERLFAAEGSQPSETPPVRLELAIEDRPSAWVAADRFSGGDGGEAATGVVVPVQLEDGSQGTLFADDMRWATVKAGQTAEVVVTAEPPRAGDLVLRAAGPPSVTGLVERDGLMQWLEEAKARFMAATLAHGPDVSSLLPGMTYGDRSGFDPALEQAMKDTGLTHLTAVSGSNCALVMVLAGQIALSLGARRRGCILAGLGALVVFVLLVGPDPSVLRAATMGSVAAVGVLAGRAGASLAALSAAMCLLLTVDPGLGTDFGFALSVCATAGIVITGRPLIRILDRWLPTTLSTVVAIPLAAQVWCAPVLSLLTPTVAVWSVPANAVVAPVVPVVTMIGLAALLTVGIGGVLGQAVAETLMFPGGWMVQFVAGAARFFAGIPGSVVPWWEAPTGPLLMLVISAVVVVVINRLDARSAAPVTSGYALPGPAPGPVPEDDWLLARRSRLRWRLAAAGIVVVCVASLLALWVFQPAARTDWQAIACDVGQGDALLLRGTAETGTTTVLIDAGPDPAAIRRCLRDAEVETLDLLILTHDHADHVGGAAGLDQQVEISRIWFSTGTGRAPQEISGWDTPSETPVPGTVLEGPGLKLRVLGPLTQPAPAVDSGGENNASLVIRAEITEREGDDAIVVSWLAAGDMEEDGARRLIGAYGADSGGPLDTDVLKVSHHGARNGGVEIIDAATPLLAVVSVGSDNTYGHPHPAITGHLAEAGIPLARTDQLGSVGLFHDDGGLTAEPLH